MAQKSSVQTGELNAYDCRRKEKTTSSSYAVEMPSREREQPRRRLGALGGFLDAEALGGRPRGSRGSRPRWLPPRYDTGVAAHIDGVHGARTLRARIRRHQDQRPGGGPHEERRLAEHTNVGREGAGRTVLAGATTARGSGRGSAPAHSLLWRRRRSETRGAPSSTASGPATPKPGPLGAPAGEGAIGALKAPVAARPPATTAAPGSPAAWRHVGFPSRSVESRRGRGRARRACLRSTTSQPRGPQWPGLPPAQGRPRSNGKTRPRAYYGRVRAARGWRRVRLAACGERASLDSAAGKDAHAGQAGRGLRAVESVARARASRCFLRILRAASVGWRTRTHENQRPPSKAAAQKPPRKETSLETAASRR